MEEAFSLDTFKANVAAKKYDEPACSTLDWDLIANFYKELGRLSRECCDVCNEIGFNMKLQYIEPEVICERCRKDIKETPRLYSAANKMDPEPMPPDLPELIMAEELLIARAHVQMEMSRVKGC